MGTNPGYVDVKWVADAKIISDKGQVALRHCANH